jgi:hypothetical protein
LTDFTALLDAFEEAARSDHGDGIAAAERDAVLAAFNEAWDDRESYRLAAVRIEHARADAESRLAAAEAEREALREGLQAQTKNFLAATEATRKALAERDEARKGQDLAEKMRRAVETAVVYRLEGEVEGHPTSRVNYLQRIDALREIERSAAAAREALRALVEALDGWPNSHLLAAVAAARAVLGGGEG